MASFNKIIIVGYLGRDPELRYTNNGQAVVNFSVATTEKKRNPAGEPEDITTWFRVSAWDRTAEFVNDYAKKGSLVYVEGRLRLNEYTDREGAKRSNLEVQAGQVNLLGKQNEEAAPVRANIQRHPAPGDAGPGDQVTESPLLTLEDDDIPF